MPGFAGFICLILFSDCCPPSLLPSPTILPSSSPPIPPTVLGLVYADVLGPQVGQSPVGPSFSLCSIFCPCSSFGQEHFWVKNFEMGGWPHPSTQGHAYLLEVVSTGSISPSMQISANGSLSFPWRLEPSSGYPHFLIPHCYIFLFNFLTLYTSLPSPLALDTAPLFPFPSLSLLGPSLPLSPTINLFFPLNAGLKHPPPGLLSS